MKILSLALMLISFNSYATDSLEFESNYRCSKYQFGIDALNEQLPEDRQLVLECESTEKSKWGGIITYDVQTKLSISTSIALCETSDHVYSKVHDFGNGIFIGYDSQGIHPLRELLEDNGVVVRGVRYGTGTGALGHEVHTLQFPYCE